MRRSVRHFAIVLCPRRMSHSHPTEVRCGRCRAQHGHSPSPKKKRIRHMKIVVEVDLRQLALATVILLTLL
jgi:hypothetical protein